MRSSSHPKLKAHLRVTHGVAVLLPILANSDGRELRGPCAEALAPLTDSIQSREERWVIADLLGKAGHIRTVPIPEWVRTAVEKWMEASAITSGALFRSIDRRGRVWGSGMTPRCFGKL